MGKAKIWQPTRNAFAHIVSGGSKEDRSGSKSAMGKGSSEENCVDLTSLPA
jgi:hypothetical protein